MAELLLKVGAGGGYEDGDAIQAFNDRRRKQAVAELICFERDDSRRLKRRKTNGLMPINDVLRDYYEQTHEFMVQKIGSERARKVRLSDGAEIQFSSGEIFEDFDGKMVHMRVGEYFKRREQALLEENAKGLPIFDGADGPIVYGGRKDHSDAKLDAVWTAIENKHGQTFADHPKFPMGALDLRHHLVLPVDDFDETTRAELEAPLLDTSTDPPTVVKKRKHWIDWPGLFPMEIPPERSEADVRAPDVAVDPRDRAAGAFSRASIVQEKTLS